jgi:hypothetical protein
MQNQPDFAKGLYETTRVAEQVLRFSGESLTKSRFKRKLFNN